MSRHIRTIPLILLVVACGHETTEPVAARTLSGNAAPNFTMSGPAVWDGQIVSIESAQRNSLGQTVCLDVPISAVDGREVNYYPCHYGPNQQFVLAVRSGVSFQAILQVAARSDRSKCLDVRSYGSKAWGGEHLQVFTCKPVQDASHQLFFVAPATPPGPIAAALATTMCVVAEYPKFALDVPLPVSVTSFVQQAGYNGGNNQLWRFRDLATGLYFGTTTGYPWNVC